jgi:MFS transporter, FHS family, L-fucose permease
MEKKALIPKKILIPFILITSLFAMWGFANDITNPMVAAFKRVLELNNVQASLVQLAFYGGYFTMALPAAIFIKKYSYKIGILIGLGLYAFGALLFYPAAAWESYFFFLIALYILTFGLAFLETTANPYILSMGPVETATRRLNFAQAFNPMGALAGLFVAKEFILNALQSNATDAEGNIIFSTLDDSAKASDQNQ